MCLYLLSHGTLERMIPRSYVWYADPTDECFALETLTYCLFPVLLKFASAGYMIVAM